MSAVARARVRLASWLAGACVAALGGCGGTPAATCPVLPSACPSPEPGYADVAPIFQERCTPCHFPGGTAATVHLYETYAEIKKTGVQIDILTTLLRCPTSNPMPPVGAPPLTDDDRATLVAWLRCDAPYDGGVPDAGVPDGGDR